jgi:hypothetical protein
MDIGEIHHPNLKEKSFVSKYTSMEDKLQLAIKYLNSVVDIR